MTDAAARAVRQAVLALSPDWIDPPVLQPAGLYLELAGEDIRARAYMLAGDEDEALCLRPDMTAPALRHALRAGAWTGAFAVAYDGLVFRRQSDGRKESEFRQIGAEVFAPRAGIAAREADIINATLAACRALKVAPRVRFGDIAVFEALVDACALPEPWPRRVKRAFARPGGLATVLREAAAPPAPDESAMAQALAVLPEDRAEAVVEELLADAGVALVGARSLAEIAARLREKGRTLSAPRVDEAALALIAETTAIEAAPDVAFRALRDAARHEAVRDAAALFAAIERAEARWAATDASGLEATFSAGFGRGLAYYDGFVFELEAPQLGARASLGGGGRYDGLLHRIASSQGGALNAPEEWGAAGFALRPQRLAEAAR
jgi:ATP phosphoribosyltransferase regulatory subunit